MREFYRAVRAQNALPGRNSPLRNRMEALRKRYREVYRHKPLHEKEVRLLAMLHDAGLPVLGDTALGQTVPCGETGKWRWEFCDVFGDERDSEAAAQAELRTLRSHLFVFWGQRE